MPDLLDADGEPIVGTLWPNVVTIAYDHRTQRFVMHQRAVDWRTVLYMITRAEHRVHQHLDAAELARRT